MLVNKFESNDFCSKNFCSKKNFGQNFFGHKKFWLKNWSNKIFGQTKYLVNKVVGQFFFGPSQG